MNEGNFGRWDAPIQRYVSHLKEEDKSTGRPYASRYVGSLVADVHRTLLYGGIYCYPGDCKNPKGKLRLMYENNPLAFLVENAGGRASDGRKRIMDIVPEDLHQRTPLFIGSPDDVQLVEDFIAGRR
jgi:fructose-1,6-bisphosphatase I